MKSILNIVYVLILLLITSSCDQSINPNAPFRERYSLNGIMKGDTSFQVVTLTHSYQPEDNNPLSYNEDPSIVGAEVNVYYDNKLYRMRDTVITGEGSSQYDVPVRCYYNPDLKPGPDKVIEIDALLPNGLLLQSISTTPDVRSIGFFKFESDRIIPPPLGSRISVSWKHLGNNLFESKFFLKYYVAGDTTLRKKEIPVRYFSDGSELIPVYPLPSGSTQLFLDLETINILLNNLPETGKTKKDYSISGIELDMIIYDEFLSSYYYSVRQGIDGFTVRLDNPDYTNIKGGFGVFGSYIRTSHQLKFTEDYLTDLGY